MEVEFGEVVHFQYIELDTIPIGSELWWFTQQQHSNNKGLMSTAALELTDCMIQFFPSHTAQR